MSSNFIAPKLLKKDIICVFFRDGLLWEMSGFNDVVKRDLSPVKTNIFSERERKKGSFNCIVGVVGYLENRASSRQEK